MDQPDRRHIATPWTVERIPGQHEIHEVFCRPDTERAFLTVDPLDDCSLDADHGLLTPTMRALVESEEGYHQRLAELEAAEQARLAELEEQAERRRAQAQAWLASDLYARMLTHFDGQIPSVLGGRYDEADQIDLFPAWWHCLIFDNLLRGKPWGTPMTSEDCCSVLNRHQVSVGPHPEWAVLAFLRHLAAHGFLRIDRFRHSPHGRIFTVQAEISGHPHFMPGVAELSGAATVDRARRGSGHQGIDRRVARHDPGGPGPWSHCRTCGLRLDPILHEIGYHFGCAPPEPPVNASEPAPTQDTLF